MESIKFMLDLDVVGESILCMGRETTGAKKLVGLHLCPVKSSTVNCTTVIFVMGIIVIN